VADPTPAGNDEIAEAAELTWAEGPGEDGARVRMFAGEIDGRGVVYAEYYEGNRLVMAVPYNRVFIDNDSESSVRSLRGLEMQGHTPEGFAFVADQGTAQLKCTALLWADATINCTRGTFAPKGSASCARYFKSNNERSQCNGIQTAFPTPQIPHDTLHALCAAMHRGESRRNECIMLGYNAPSAATFRDTHSACTAAYRTSEERSFCMVFLLGTPAPRPSVDLIRECDREHDDDKATTDCVWLKHTGVEQVHPKSRTSLPTDEPTAPVANNAKPSKKRLSGGRIDVTSGTLRDLSVRVTGGMVGTEPVLWVDGFRGAKHEWMAPVDRIVVGKQVRALREVSSIDKIKLSGELLTFRAVLGGKKLQCRADAGATFATCR
jgi:hypothetical protein